MIVEIYMMAYTMQKCDEDETTFHTHVCEEFKNDVALFKPKALDFLTISYDEDLYVTKFLQNTFNTKQLNEIKTLKEGGLTFNIGYYTIKFEYEYNFIDDIEWLKETFIYMQQKYELIASFFLIPNGTEFNIFKHFKSSHINEKSDFFEEANNDFNEYGNFFTSYLKDLSIKDEDYFYIAKLLLNCVEE